MGSFSWLSVQNKRRSLLEGEGAVLLIPKEFCKKGTKFEKGFIETDDFEFGNIDNEDVYALVARWNEPNLCIGVDDVDRSVGIRIACYDEDHKKLKYPIKLVEKSWFESEFSKGKKVLYEDFKDFSLSCPNQGWNHPL